MLPATFNDFSSGFDAANAHYLAVASDWAYRDPGEGLEQGLEVNLGLRHLRFFDERRPGRSTHAFVAADTNKVIVAFRGTEPDCLGDWFTDVNVRPEPTVTGDVHRGFYRALDDVWDAGLFDYVQALGARPLDLREVIERGEPAQITQPPRRTLWITGHSLGGALANLMAGRLAFEEDYPFDGVYTYGQPRAASHEYARAYNIEARERHHRMVNNNDLVTRVPTRRMGFSHMGGLRYFDVEGNLHTEISWWHRFLDRVSGRLEDYLEVFERRDLVTDGLEDHRLREGYIARLEAWLEGGQGA